MSVELTPWALKDQRAELQFGPIVGRVDMAHPREGLQICKFGTDAFSASLFGIAGIVDDTWRVRDRYVRQPDAIVAYDVDRKDEVSRTIYWRCESVTIEGVACHQVSCLISLDTQELDTHPSDSLVSTLPASEVSVRRRTGETQWSMVPASDEPALVACDEMESGLILARGQESDWSLGLAIHPSDLERLSVQTDDANDCLIIKHDLVAPRLEKGVIRRFRAAAVCVPRENDEELASAWCSLYADAAPPLTT